MSDGYKDTRTRVTAKAHKTMRQSTATVRAVILTSDHERRHREITRFATTCTTKQGIATMSIDAGSGGVIAAAPTKEMTPASPSAMSSRTGTLMVSSAMRGNSKPPSTCP